MNRIAFVFALIFLAIGMFVAPIALVTQSDSDLDNILNQAPNLADETRVHVLISDLDAGHQRVLTIVLTVEIVCIVLFAISLWIALKP